jgi:hypothetical protein
VSLAPLTLSPPRLPRSFLCTNLETGFTLVGDTAQAIAQGGSVFRFEVGANNQPMPRRVPAVTTADRAPSDSPTRLQRTPPAAGC